VPSPAGDSSTVTVDAASAAHREGSSEYELSGFF